MFGGEEGSIQLSAPDSWFQLVASRKTKLEFQPVKRTKSPAFWLGFLLIADN
jgi:hypothetical protein